MKTGKWPKTESFADRLRGSLCKKPGGEIRLSRISSYEGRAIFRMDGYGSPACVKAISNATAARRAYAYLGWTRLGFIPKARFLLEWEGVSVMGMDWKDGRVVFSEDMNERQGPSLSRAHRAVLDELRGSDCADPIGSPTQDLTYDFIRRFRKSGLSRGAEMGNLKDRFLQMANAGVYFPDDLA